MLHELKSNYQSIAKYFPGLSNKISSSVYNKQQLLKMAESGENRPTNKTKLGMLLSSYTTKSSQSFDNKFYEKIKSIRPQWFISQTEIANQKKNELIKMAKNREDRPSQKIRLGQALSNYITKNSKTFDKEFYEKIKSIRPDWLFSRIDIVNQKKKELLRMAKSRANKPSIKTKLGQTLSNYTIKSSRSFDKKFYENIKSIRPEWFISRTEIANQNKNRLIKIAKKGEIKPSRKIKIGQRLSEYVRKSSGSFDKKFYEKIKSIRPDWLKR